MMWLTWRQHRIEVIVGGVLLLLAAGFLLVTVPAGGTSAVQLTPQQGFVSNITLLFSLFPLLIGIFLGAPLVAREVEQGTHRLIWTQSVTRVRWLLEKAGILAGVVAAFAILLGGSARFWGSPVNIWWSFDIQAPVLLAYSLYALMVGIALSVFVRRTVAAMALTIPAFIVPRAAVFLLRRFFLPAITYTWDPIQADPRAALNDWRTSAGLIDRQGQPVSMDYAHQICEGSGGTPSQGKFGPLNQCWHDHGFLQQVSYHPASQFWIFQGIEVALFLGLTALLVFVTAWFLKYRMN